MPAPTSSAVDSAISEYELIDFGRGKKLERFGDRRIERPCATARRLRHGSPGSGWRPDATYRRRTARAGAWTYHTRLPDPWIVQLDGVVLELRPTPAGQLGVFPEQGSNWRWIRRQVRAAGRPLRILNLFAYTGGGTIAAAAAGAQVVHVDAAKNVVDWARHNARLSGLAAHTVQWITDDVLKFAAREVRRGCAYDGVILDPPSYGHGPGGESWQIDRDLPRLLQACRQLLVKQPVLFLLTCHSPGWGPPELQAALDSLLFGSCQAGSRGQRLWLVTADGRRLPAGVAARWPGDRGVRVP